MSKKMIRLASALGAVGALVALAACAPAPEPTPEPTQTEASSPEPTPYAGPVVAIGDELADFLLTEEEITELIPGATEVGTASAHLEQISDGSGTVFTPAICGILYTEQSLFSVGTRTISWKLGDTTGQQIAMQFADEALAAQRMDQLTQAAQGCATFDAEGQNTFDAAFADSSDEVRAFAGPLVSASDWQILYGYASTGNVVVQLAQQITGDAEFDTAALAAALADRAEQARAELVEELAAVPATPVPEPDADAGGPWSEWQITSHTVGPISVGGSMKVALAAVPDAQLAEPEYESGPWTVTAADGSASLRIQASTDGESVESVIVGSDHSAQPMTGDPAVLPAAGDVRIGDGLADVAAAFPGGTRVHIVSAGLDQYVIADRDGGVLTFHFDSESDDATVIGITSADGALGRTLSY